MQWIYQGKPIKELPDWVAGFVYEITNTQNGKKYIGIYNTIGTQQSIWGGVVKEDSADGLLKKGDILKAAGYGAYTMVGAGKRGNVLEGNFSVSWTGANYL